MIHSLAAKRFSWEFSFHPPQFTMILWLISITLFCLRIIIKFYIKKKSHIFISLITFQTHIGIDEVLNSKSPNIWLDFGIYIRFYFTACGSTDQMLEPSWHCWNFESQIWFPNLKVKAKQKSISYTAREREMVEVLNNNAIHHYWWSCWSKWQWSSWFIVQCIKIHHNFNGR